MTSTVLVLVAISSTIYAMPAWRMAMSASLVYSRLGNIPRASNAQHLTLALRPAGVTRFGSHIEIPQAILTRDPDYARTVIGAIPAGHMSLPVRRLAKEAGLNRIPG